MNSICRILAALAALTLLSGCAAVAVTGAALSVASTAVVTTAKVGGAAVGGAIDLVTDDDEEEE
ncbi:hypothetical protein E1162_11825 [Rhodobacteraceae bacterium RKSG542]|uniref:hypothetical protein n=1 Tax=Pseudovibrio flavus TaxID=2529854 RepID=UPI0012BBE797|nr:hypothetical protein [Pseudovibrio flavus]MTI17925.1 hypothetical protein [Pseudovibrio flavus]